MLVTLYEHTGSWVLPNGGICDIAKRYHPTMLRRTPYEQVETRVTQVSSTLWWHRGNVDIA